MFGYILPNLESLGEEEKLRYHAVYCGVCRSIRTRYGQRCRLTVSYDMTFLAMVLGSLYEPEEHASQKRCPVHPLQPRQVAQSEFTDYAADLSVAMAYHKCLDDWRDDHSAKARAAAVALEMPYCKAKRRIPQACQAIEDTMAGIHSIEEAALGESDGSRVPEGCLAGGVVNLDAAANRFGILLGDLFAYKDELLGNGFAAFWCEIGKSSISWMP